MNPVKSTAVAVTKPSALNLMASRLSVDPAKLFETLKATVFKNSTNEELLALVVVANSYNLNPFTREIFGFPAKGGGIVPVVSVDGWNSMLIRQPDFDGIEFEFEEDENRLPIACTATIYIKNRSHPVKVTEFFVECQRNTEPWKTMPHRMLRNRTLCQASRVAFGFSGIKHEEEAEAISVEAIVTTTPQTPPPKVIPPTDGKTPQAELETLCVSNGHTFETFRKWGEESGNLDDAGSLGGFAEVATDVARRLLRAEKGLLAGLEKIKSGV